MAVSCRGVVLALAFPWPAAEPRDGGGEEQADKLGAGARPGSDLDQAAVVEPEHDRERRGAEAVHLSALSDPQRLFGGPHREHANADVHEALPDKEDVVGPEGPGAPAWPALREGTFQRRGTELAREGRRIRGEAPCRAEQRESQHRHQQDRHGEQDRHHAPLPPFPDAGERPPVARNPASSRASEIPADVGRSSQRPRRGTSAAAARATPMAGPTCALAALSASATSVSAPGASSTMCTMPANLRRASRAPSPGGPSSRRNRADVSGPRPCWRPFWKEGSIPAWARVVARVRPPMSPSESADGTRTIALSRRNHRLARPP